MESHQKVLFIDAATAFYRIFFCHDNSVNRTAIADPVAPIVPVAGGPGPDAIFYAPNRLIEASVEASYFATQPELTQI